MPEDNTQIATDNNQMATPVPSTNDDTTQTPVDVPSEPVQSLETAEPVQPVDPVQPTVPAQPADSDAVVTPGQEAPVAETGGAPVSGDVRSEIAAKIGEAKNVLIALSGDPSVDELAAAIGLSLYLDKIGKRATAIYSGTTPNTLEFLKPEETFETSADTLQDFVIAISKEKADHLRYKIDGDYVKVYITPYKHKITEGDLDFSYGDYNVDLVIALDVANGIDLDSALREHGRIMHDASIVNVTTGNPGKFGEIEWSDKKASSVSEMISELLYEYGGENQINKEEATAFLTGVVAATNRFSNANTTPEAMRLSSKLMESGANQQLVSKNITPDTENELFDTTPKDEILGKKKDEETESAEDGESKKKDSTKLDIEHNKDEKKADAENDNAESEKEMDAEVTKKEHNLLDDLKAAEESLSHAGEETTPVEDKTVRIENGKMTSDGSGTEPEPVLPEPVVPEPVESEPETPEAVEPVSPEPVAPALEIPEPEASEPEAQEESQADIQEVASKDKDDSKEEGAEEQSEKVINPSADFDANAEPEDMTKYGEMLQDALESNSAPVEPTAPIMSDPDSGDNPATANTPEAPAAPEINGVPEMNYMPMPGTEILPPPPTPPIGEIASEPPIESEVVPAEPVQPAEPVSEPVQSAEPVAGSESAPLGEQPAMQDQVYNPQANDPGAFKIPGM